MDRGGKKKEQATKLLEALNTSSAQNRNLQLGFITFLFYIAITALQTNHAMLLKNSDVKLPVLNIDIPLFSFYLIAPMLVVILHLDFLLNIREHMRKLDTWVTVSKDINADKRVKAEFVFPFLFNHERLYKNEILSFLPRLFNLATAYFLPIITLILVQYKFLPYHSLRMTIMHSVLIAIDVGCLLRLWAQIKGGDAKFPLLHYSFVIIILAIVIII